MKSAIPDLRFCVAIAWCAIYTVNGQNIQLVPNGVCLLMTDTSNCFDLTTHTITVGKEVTSLDNLYKFCTQEKRLQMVTFTNTTVNPPDMKTGLIIVNPADSNRYTVRAPPSNLQFGVNTFIIAITMIDASNIPKTAYDTITIIRSTSSGLGTDNLFTLQCGADTALLSITCGPPTLLSPAYDTVIAKINNAADTAKFTPNDVLVRAFIPFPDNDGNTVALFHLDDNLANKAPNGTSGSGTVTYTSSNAAFYACMSGGTFTATPSTPLKDFTVECWIYPANQASTIIAGNGFAFGITADGYLSATIGSTIIKTNHVIDKSVWQCVAVVRSGGNANIYVNGIPMAPAANATGTISGSLTISSVAGGLLDEVRISSVARSQQILGKTVLQLPLADQVSWNVNNVQTTGKTARVPFTMWQGTPKGQVRFLFSSPLPGPMIVNFFDTSSSPVAVMWSKNGDPVLFTTTPLPVIATLRDTSHEGHLDMIDLTWTDNSIMKTPLPSVNQLVSLAYIVRLNGTMDSLHPAAMMLDAANKVIHISLAENSSHARSTVQGDYETGWIDAKIALSTDLMMTTDGRSLIVTQVIDGATPIPIKTCYASAPNRDSLWITMSEPVSLDSSGKPTSMLRSDGATLAPLFSFEPLFAGSMLNKILFVFNYTGGNHVVIPSTHKVAEQFDPGPTSPLVDIGSCANGIKVTFNTIIAGARIANVHGAYCSSGAIIQINYTLPKAELVAIRLYNLEGQLESMPFNEFQAAGYYSLNIQSMLPAAGSYLVVFNAGNLHREKMIFFMK